MCCMSDWIKIEPQRKTGPLGTSDSVIQPGADLFLPRGRRVADRKLCFVGDSTYCWAWFLVCYFWGKVAQSLEKASFTIQTWNFTNPPSQVLVPERLYLIVHCHQVICSYKNKERCFHSRYLFWSSIFQILLTRVKTEPGSATDSCTSPRGTSHSKKALEGFHDPVCFGGKRRMRHGNQRAPHRLSACELPMTRCPWVREAALCGSLPPFCSSRAVLDFLKATGRCLHTVLSNLPVAFLTSQ